MLAVGPKFFVLTLACISFQFHATTCKGLASIPSQEILHTKLIHCCLCVVSVPVFVLVDRFAVVFDVTQRQSFEDVSTLWFDNIVQVRRHNIIFFQPWFDA